MRMRRSSRQWRISANHASCSPGAHSFDPGTQRSFTATLTQSGVGICWPDGGKLVSCALKNTPATSTTATTASRVAMIAPDEFVQQPHQSAILSLGKEEVFAGSRKQSTVMT